MNGTYRENQRSRAAIILAQTLVLCALLPGVAAGSSVEDAGAGDPGMRVLAGRLPVASTNTYRRELWLWPEGRRGFQLNDASVPARGGHVGEGGCIEGVPKTIPTTQLPFPQSIRCAGSNLETSERQAMELVAFDLDTNEELQRQVVEPNLRIQGEAQLGGGHSNMGAIDPATGRLFLPFIEETVEVQGLKEKDYPGQVLAGTADGGQTCPPGTATQVCVGGIAVIDGATLQVTKTIPLSPLTIGDATVRPLLRAVEWAPPTEGGAPGKVLMIIEDTAHWPGTGNNSTATKGANILYLVQMDPESGRQDWALRVDACRYSRDSFPDNSVATYTRPNPVTVFRDASPDAPAVWIGCHAGPVLGTVVRVPLDANGAPSALPVQAGMPEVGDLIQGGEPRPDGLEPAAVVTTTSGQEVFPGPEGAVELLADPASGRILMKVIAGDPKAEVWWIFDTRKRNYIGTIGIGPLDSNLNVSVAGLDRTSGRLYVFVPPYPGVNGGLYVADVRRSPLSQALTYPHLASLVDWDVTGEHRAGHNLIMPVDPGNGERKPRIYWRHANHAQWTVIQDATTPPELGSGSSFDGRSLDLDEAEGVTSAAYDGAARGYGARLLMVGGLEAMLRAGQVDAGIYHGAGPRGGLIGSSEFFRPLHPVRDLLVDPCGTADREVVLASVGAGSPAVVDVSGGRGSARPLSVDSTLAADLEAPFSRCAPMDWEELWATGLMGRSPMPEPSVPSDALFGKDEATCLASDEHSSDRAGGGLLNSSTTADPVQSPLAASVTCSPEEVSGWSQARITQIGEVAVTNAYSSFRLYRDPGRGVVARVESVARGVSVPGAFRVDTVRSVAESWANGRKQGVSAAQREVGYDPNCDSDRTAGTCFVRHMFGVWTPGYQCGPCGDESRVEAALTRAMGSNGTAKLRKPDPVLAAGAENGFIAAVQKPDHERFSDLVLNNDLLQTVVPGLEIIRFANPGNRMPGNSGGRGRQIYQFAGVEVSSSYAISCLLVYDEAANTCAEPAEAPGSIVVSLSDSDGKPLAGGAFEVRQDVDTDGVLGLKDTLLANGACVTADDGVGTCKLDNLQPGSYLVSQVAAPPGYAKSAEPFVVDLASGEQRTVAFTNVSNVSTVDVKATDEHGAPVSGATFAAYPDGDSDGKVAPDAKPAAECTTDAQGVCQMKVPAGSYVLVQTSAPGGLEGIEPVPFTFASGGQVASVSVVNYPPESPAQLEGSAAPIDYTPPVDYSPPVEIVDDGYVPVDDASVTVDEPAVSVPERIGGTVTQVIRAPGDALRLLARDPKQAVAWTAALALFCLAIMAVRRRQQAMALLNS